jgi:hypothetical protein
MGAMWPRDGKTRLIDWVLDHALLIQTLGAASLVLLVVSLVALPVVVAYLPPDYFTREKRQPAHRERKHWIFWGTVSVIKNAVGLVLILVGIILLLTPGQGILTILIGLTMTNFPGKYRLERKIAAQPTVGKGLNRVRALAGRPPLLLPPAETTNSSS